MILIIDLCYRKDSLSYDEFVRPIEKIVRTAGEACTIRHYTEITETDLSGSDRVILCGTTLKDNAFLRHPEKFSWIRSFPRPVLGICAGMEILSVIFGGTVQENPEIGMTDIRSIVPDPLFAGHERFSAYELHGLATTPPPDFAVIAESDQCIQGIRHHTLPFYGVMFHPEVRNDWVVERFLRC